MARYRPRYTSMECYEESDEWSLADEPFAIFVGLNWTNRTAPTVFVRRTRVYSGVDKGEKKYTRNRKDNKTLTKSGKYTDIDTDSHLIMVQGMEHDWGSPNGTTFILRTVLESLGPYIILAKRFDKSKIKSGVTELMNIIIKKSKGIAGSSVTVYQCNRLRTKLLTEIGLNKTISQIISAHITLTSFKTYFKLGVAQLRPDNKIGKPKELSLSGGNGARKELQFGKKGSGSGKIGYKFTIDRKS